MKICTEKVDVEIFPEELRWFKIESADELKQFLETISATRKEAGFNPEEKK